MIKYGFMLKINVILFLLVAFTATAQQSAQPGSKLTYTNTVTYDVSRDSYFFNCSDSSGRLLYFRCAAGSPGFSAIYVSADNGLTEFRPSIGGLTVVLDGTVTQYFGGQAIATKLSQSLVQDTLITNWRLKRSGTTPAAVDTFDFTSKYYIKGRTLVNELLSSARNVSNVTFDRCEDVINPKLISVPYLSGFNILLANNNLFVSSFFDWTKSNATRNPVNSGTVTGSTTSIRYAPNATYNTLTNGMRNTLMEKAYITVSDNLSEVLPNIPNPVSKYKGESANRVVFDYWQDARNINAGAGVTANHYSQLLTGGIDRSTLWLILHPWQNQGYDNGYPDVQPARSIWGGDAQLKSASDTVTNAGGFFSVHENYTTIHNNAPSYPSNTGDIAKLQNGSPSNSGTNSFGATGYDLKPSAAPMYSARYSPSIHASYNTIGSYIDVCSSIPLGFNMDFDAAIPNTGKYNEVLKNYQALYDTLRQAHKGPVSGEGNQHMYAVGYVDDVEAQPGMAINNGNIGGWKFPLLVDFQHEKMNPKAFVHGMGYIARFYGNQTQPAGVKFSRDSILMYMATTLAYGNGGFITTPDRIYDFVDYAQLTQKHIYPFQKYFVSSSPISIFYNDNGTMLTASQYISKYPTDYKDFTSANFMGQVRVEYSNGMIVCVNRHPTKEWNVDVGQPGGRFNYYATISGNKVLDTLTSNSTTYLLHVKSGWVCYMPAGIDDQIPIPVPGVVQAENFNTGAGGIAYHDTDISNNGAAYRSTAVDLEQTNDAGGGFAVRDMLNGEWLKYTINVTMTNNYSITARVASLVSGNLIRLEIDGQIIADSITFNGTGGEDLWATVNLGSNINIPQGSHTLRFFIINGSFKMNFLSFIGSTTLPVALLNYKAVLEVNKVNLNWITSSEVNADRFEIEKSTDAINFQKIGTVKAKGNTNLEQQYNIYDNTPFSGTNYYKLVQYDKDGKKIVHGIRSVNYNINSKLRCIVYPNPANQQAYLQIETSVAGKGEIKLVDGVGRIVKTQSFNGYKGINTIPLNMDKSALSGIYILKVILNGQELHQTILFTR